MEVVVKVATLHIDV